LWPARHSAYVVTLFRTAPLVVGLGLLAAADWKADVEGQALEKDGALVAIVTWGDVDNTPARNVVVEVFGYGRKNSREKSVLLKPSQDGRYEASLQPGLYDVFVSEATSVPRCRRLEIKAGETKYWTLKLEIDDVYLDKSKAVP